MSAFLSQSSKASQKEGLLTPASRCPYWPQLLKPGSPLLGIFFPGVLLSTQKEEKVMSQRKQ